MPLAFAIAACCMLPSIGFLGFFFALDVAAMYCPAAVRGTELQQAIWLGSEVHQIQACKKINNASSCFSII